MSGQIKDFYGKIISENELSKLTEKECENIYKICELKTAKKSFDYVIDGIVLLQVICVLKLCQLIIKINIFLIYKNIIL